MNGVVIGITTLVAIIFLFILVKIVKEHERGVILRLGHLARANDLGETPVPACEAYEVRKIVVFG